MSEAAREAPICLGRGGAGLREGWEGLGRRMSLISAATGVWSRSLWAEGPAVQRLCGAGTLELLLLWCGRGSGAHVPVSRAWGGCGGSWQPPGLQLSQGIMCPLSSGAAAMAVGEAAAWIASRGLPCQQLLAWP